MNHAVLESRALLDLPQDILDKDLFDGPPACSEFKGFPARIELQAMLVLHTRI
jgi:hypothetical protein